jgi:hypothetical protein
MTETALIPPRDDIFAKSFSFPRDAERKTALTNPTELLGQYLFASSTDSFTAAESGTLSIKSI